MDISLVVLPCNIELDGLALLPQVTIRGTTLSATNLAEMVHPLSLFLPPVVRLQLPFQDESVELHVRASPKESCRKLDCHIYIVCRPSGHTAQEPSE